MTWVKAPTWPGILDTLDRHDLKILDVSAVPNPGAEAARRYRARKRGEDVPKRKPGPKPALREPQSPVPLLGTMRREWAALWRRYSEHPEFRKLVRDDLACRCGDRTATETSGDLKRANGKVLRLQADLHIAKVEITQLEHQLAAAKAGAAPKTTSPREAPG